MKFRLSPTLKKRLLILGSAIVVVTIGIAILMRWISGSNTGTVRVGTPKPITKQAAPVSPLTIDTAYFTTAIPGSFTVKRQVESTTSPTLLELVAYNKHQQFAITLGVLPGTGLSGLGDYNLRVTNTTDYAPYRPAGLPLESTAFRTTNGPAAFTTFWPHGNLYAEVTLSSDDGSSLGQLFTIFEQASHNWQWR